MSLKSGIFSSTSFNIDAYGIAVGNKAVDAEFISKIFSLVFSNGVIDGFECVLKNDQIVMQSGAAILQGYWGYDTEEYILPGYLPIVSNSVRISLSVDLLKGEYTRGWTQNTTPTRTQYVYEIILAEVFYDNGGVSKIVDLRENDYFCGYSATLNVKPSIPVLTMKVESSVLIPPAEDTEPYKVFLLKCDNFTVSDIPAPIWWMNKNELVCLSKEWRAILNTTDIVNNQLAYYDPVKKGMILLSPPAKYIYSIIPNIIYETIPEKVTFATAPFTVLKTTTAAANAMNPKIRYALYNLLLDDRKPDIFDITAVLKYNAYFRSNTSVLNLTAGSNYRTAAIPCNPNTSYTIRKLIGGISEVATTSILPIAGTGTTGTIVENSSSFSSTAAEKVYLTNANAKYLLIWYWYNTSTPYTENQVLESITIFEN